jgi:hypothetical protein
MTRSATKRRGWPMLSFRERLHTSGRVVSTRATKRSIYLAIQPPIATPVMSDARSSQFATTTTERQRADREIALETGWHERPPKLRFYWQSRPRTYFSLTQATK